MASVKEIIKHVSNHSRKAQIDVHQQLNAWLDYMIEYFDVEQYLTPYGWSNMQDAKYKESPELFSATAMWMQLVADSLEERKSQDVLGSVYEELFQSKTKSSSLGQFFTPTSVCDLMARIVGVGDCKLVNDCACGSGRTLIAHYMECIREERPTNSYYVAEDIDVTSIKMCALNMMMYGMRGRVVRHDTLTQPVSFDFGFEINEVRYPLPTPFYSLRRISLTDSEKKEHKRPKSENEVLKPKQAQTASIPDKDGQYSLFF